MSDKRDPATDQSLPVPGQEEVHQAAIDDLTGWNLDPDVREAIEKGLAARRALGISKYGRPLETHNGRDALLDAWQEALDLFAYAYQLELEHPNEGIADSVTGYAESALESLTRMRLERGDDIQ
jgi:hypothetical protein